ncbi:MAG: hypothetical protein ACOVQM_18490, partial [Pirellula sp.]
MRNRLTFHHLIAASASTLALCLCATWGSFVFGQQDPNSLVTQYQLARQAYSSKQYDESSKLFRSVASQCPGSELATQCEYYGIMSEWAVKPSEEAAQSLSRWIDESQSSIKKAKEAGRTLDNRLLNSWIESSQLLCAQWDRQHSRSDEAERRLRSLLASRPTSSEHDVLAATAWFELGMLLLQNKSTYSEAKECFNTSIANCAQQLKHGP